MERYLSKQLDLVKIKGKRGRHVPVLLTGQMKAAVTLLCSLREKIEIQKENKYIFSNGANGYIRPWDILNQMCNSVELKNPNAINSNNMRKF